MSVPAEQDWTLSQAYVVEWPNQALSVTDQPSEKQDVKTIFSGTYYECVKYIYCHMLDIKTKVILHTYG